MTSEAQPMRITMKGKPITLVGEPLAAGARAPEFRVVDAGFKPVALSSFAGRVVLISAVQSLDTGVCTLQTKRFNEEAGRLPPEVAILTISTDLPYAQRRFCQAETVSRVQVLSDCVWREFGLAFRVLIPDMGVLARSIWVVGRDGRISYREVVPETSSHPDYEAALKAARDTAAG